MTTHSHYIANCNLEEVKMKVDDLKKAIQYALIHQVHETRQQQQKKLMMLNSQKYRLLKLDRRPTIAVLLPSTKQATHSKQRRGRNQ